MSWLGIKLSQYAYWMIRGLTRIFRILITGGPPTASTASISISPATFIGRAVNALFCRRRFGTVRTAQLRRLPGPGAGLLLPVDSFSFDRDVISSFTSRCRWGDARHYMAALLWLAILNMISLAPIRRRLRMGPAQRPDCPCLRHATGKTPDAGAGGVVKIYGFAMPLIASASITDSRRARAARFSAT